MSSPSKVFVLARNRGNKALQAVLIFTADESGIAFAEHDREKWQNAGSEAIVVFGEDLRDVIKSFPDWLEEAA